MKALAGIHKYNTLYICTWLAALIFVLTGCSGGKASYSPDKKYAAGELRQDVDVLWQTFQKNHPSLYWYNSKDSVENAFAQLSASLTDSLTEPGFRLRLAKAVATIHCGHTTVRPSKAASRYREIQRRPMFPLQVKTWQPDSMVVLSNAFRADSHLVRGAFIHRINGRPVRQILDSIFQFISADGLHDSFKYQLVSNNFPSWYKSIFGLASINTIDITGLDGKPLTVNIKNFDPAADSTRRPDRANMRQLVPAPRQPRLSRERNLVIDTARSLAIMELNTFSKGRLPSFFRKTFRTLRKNNIQNLVIELRENGGGNIMNSTRLTQYIANKPFKVADTVAAISLQYPWPRLVKGGLFFKFQSWAVARRQADGRLHYRMYERKFFKPKTKNHFDGKVFILTGGFTFSASTLFINPIQGQPNVTVIGEETGGSAIGNTAVNIPDLRLPNTGVRVRLPLYRLVASKNIPLDGRGILPDIYVPPTSWHLTHRLDPKIMKVYELLDK